MINAQHEKLCMLARLKSDRALAALATELSVRAALAVKVDALSQSVKNARSYAANDISFGGNVASIEAFCASQTKRIHAEIQKSNVRIASLKVNAANEFGRVTVLEKLLKA